MILNVKNLNFSYGSVPVLKDVNLEAFPGSITALIGPNAAGKSTLLKCIAGVLKSDGRILLNGRALDDLSVEERSKIIGYLPQVNFSSVALRVFEVVLLGRVHYLSWKVDSEDLDIVSDVLGDLGIEDLASRYIGELSGGQQQMVAIAQALVRKPNVLLLDEPMNSLDLRNQLEVIDIVREVTKQRGLITIMAVHDLNLAARYADSFVVINNGRVCIEGDSRSVITPRMVGSIYGVDANVYIDEDGIPQVSPKRALKDNMEYRRERSFYV